MERSRNLILSLAASLLLLIVGAFAYGAYRAQFQTVTIGSKNSFSIKFYKSEGGEDGAKYDSDKVVLNPVKAGDYKLKKGVYVYVISGPSSDYKTVTQQVSVKNDPVYVAVKGLDYTNAKLARLTAEEEPDILKAVQTKYSSQLALYVLQTGKLYKNGEWYGAKLVPKDPTNLDTLRVILEKKSSGWTIITIPPEIIISQPVYPQIPFDVLTDVNNFL